MNESDKLPAVAVINGAVDQEVKYLSGEREIVKVKLVPISKFDEYLTAKTVLPSFVEYICGKDKGWADTLDDESIYKIEALAKTLNDPRVDRFIKRQQETVNEMQPLVAKVAELNGFSPKQ